MRLAAKGENIYWSQNKATLSGALGAPCDYAKCYLAGTKSLRSFATLPMIVRVLRAALQLPKGKR